MTNTNNTGRIELRTYETSATSWAWEDKNGALETLTDAQYDLFLDRIEALVTYSGHGSWSIGIASL